MTKKVLGRGLGAFFPEYDKEEGEDEKGERRQKTKTAVPIEPAEKVNVVLDIPVDHIRANPHQPRTDFKEEALEELADSIKKHGLIQPITVRYLGEKRFELISGERRLRASKLAGLSEIPSYIREVNDEQMIAFALIENIQREQLNPLEIAMGYQRLMEECSYTQGEVAERVGKNRTTVTNMLRLLQLPDFIQAALRDEKISTGHARSLINLDKEKDQRDILKKILSKNLSVRQTEDLVRSLDKKNEQKKTSPATKARSPFVESIEKRLRNNLSTKVNIKQKAKGGEIRIEYYSNDDLERLLQILDEDR
ncbi:ParB/RepB/Spo0J family partition protein [Rhodohalobacter sp. SW132]|uniref:ParB/RepB/Spo0J family partition protein n=1 Tax=Rhodohalobacter sp. SW132 TaxID=2293433 RepID=UPI000E22A181|nr:ParB/RepB/Spo0J family partition protein [Rhodohalobacter sp. SW132]REL38140.1 ParB/RepB/Spo0J family partition protein [Rhodohalobacter sp. SW132]